MSVIQQGAHGWLETLSVPAAANSGDGPNSGDPLVFGRGTSPNFGLAGVAETSYTPPTGNPTGQISVSFEGVYFLPVVAKDDIGGSSITMEPGAAVYATGGTYDSVTGVLYGFTLTGNATTGVYYGNTLDAIIAGATTTVRVRLKKSGRG